MAPRKKLGEILVQAGVLTDAQLRSALTEQKRWGGPLGRCLIDMKLITEEAMVQALSHQLNFPAVNLDTRNIDPKVLEVVPAELAEQHGVVPFSAQGKFLDVAMSDPTNLGIIDELRIRTRMNVRPYLAGPKQIERAIAKFYGRGFAQIDFSAGPPSNLAGVGLQPAPAQTRQPSPVQGIPIDPMPAAGSASGRRAQPFELSELVAKETEHTREIASLQGRVAQLEALVARDEDVLRKLLALMVEKGVATREEILERIK